MTAMLFTVLAAPPAESQEFDPRDHVIIFVIDLSGSMNREFGSQSRLEVAQDAFSEAFRNVNENAVIGLRVYGDQFDTAPDPESSAWERNCREDTRQVLAPEPVDRERLLAQVADFEASGETPVGLSLKAAAEEDIPDGSTATIVLFSDGQDECWDADTDGDGGPSNPPSYGDHPCDVAKELTGSDDSRVTQIISVGFGVDEVGEEQLRCISSATRGGFYRGISTPEDARDILAGLLAELGSARAAERLPGEAIDGTPSRGGAPTIARLAEDAGEQRYVDTIEMNGENWYRVDEYGPGFGILSATTFDLPAQAGISFGVRLFSPDEDRVLISRTNSNAGLPFSPSASVRCPCGLQSIDMRAEDVYWVISLESEDAELSGTYELEFLVEGKAFGGESGNCQEPQACWYEQQMLVADEAIASLEDEYGDLLDDAVGDELRQQYLDLKAVADSQQAAADAASRRLAALERQASEQQPGGIGLPVLLLLLGLAAGAASFYVDRFRPVAVASGWYPDPDPESTDSLRWWDGDEWTDVTQPDPGAGS